MRYSVNVNGKNFDVEIKKIDENFVMQQQQIAVPVAPIAPVVPTPVVQTQAIPETTSNLEVVSPMPGAVLKILVDIGQEVKEAQPIMILEAMKMEIEVNAPKSGFIKQILVNVGSSVGANDVLIVMN